MIRRYFSVKLSLSDRRIKESGFSVSLLKISMLFSVFLQFFIDTGFYEYARIILYVFFALTFISIIMVNPVIETDKFLNRYLGFITAVVVFIIIVSFLKGEWILTPLIEFVMPFVVLLMGYQSKIGSYQTEKLIRAYLYLVTFLGVFIIFYHGNGFTISSQYFLASKNQVGPFLSSASLISLLLLLNSKTGGSITKNWSLYFVLFINMATLLSLRNRSGIFAFVICLTLYYISKIRFSLKINFKKIFLFFVTTIFITIIQLSTNFLGYIFEMIYQSLFLNTNIHDVNSLSSGRFIVFENVFDFLAKAPLFGEITMVSGITDVPHNYLLRLWLNYGLLGSLPLTLFYLFLWIFTLYNIVIKNEYDLGLYLLLLMLVISLFEYTFPYGPLTTIALTWLLLGIYLKNKKSSRTIMLGN